MMNVLQIIVHAWPIILMMSFLFWARSYANSKNTDPPKGSVMLILILVLFINLNRIQMPSWTYLFCLPPAFNILLNLWKAPKTKIKEDQNEL